MSSEKCDFRNENERSRAMQEAMEGFSKFKVYEL